MLKIKAEVNKPIQVSAQNAFNLDSGAYTGEISPTQLKDAGINWVILGHSERRALFGDSDHIVAEKTRAALAAGLSVIACVGETLEEREKGITKEVVERQLEAIAAVVKPEDWS